MKRPLGLNKIHLKADVSGPLNKIKYNRLFISKIKHKMKNINILCL